MDKPKAALLMPFVRSPYNYDRGAAGDESGLKCEDASLARQSEAEEADINTIVRRFGLTGQLPQNVRVPSYGDFSDVFDFQSAMNVVTEAREAFLEMPADVRARFHNDPAEFVAFVGDDRNRDEAIKLGVVVPVEPPKAPEPMLVKVVPDAPQGDSGKS